MKRQTLDGHPSVTIAHSPSGNLLMAVYDSGYPQVSYRFSANNIGGNPKKTDKSPISTLEREITEEFDSKHDEKNKFRESVSWVVSEQIELVRNALIKDLTPYKDFLVSADKLPNDPTTTSYTAIFSSFTAKVPEDVINMIVGYIGKCLVNVSAYGKVLTNYPRFTTEGLTGIFTIDDLTRDSKGKLSTAHATAPILNDFFESNIPFPEQIQASSIGTPRESYKDYTWEFNYPEHAWRH